MGIAQQNHFITTVLIILLKQQLINVEYKIKKGGRGTTCNEPWIRTTYYYELSKYILGQKIEIDRNIYKLKKM